MQVPAPRIVVPIAIAVLAAVSLLAPFSPVYDGWAWLVWGREIVGLDLDTAAGPSWKPLPVMIDALLSLTGGAAPDLWLFVARVGWLAAVALAYRLAWRLMFPARVATGLAARFAPKRVRLGRNLAGALAAIGILLLFDPFTPWWRQAAGGLAEPMLTALVLGAIDRELSRRSGQALALAFCAALIRPEAWPLLALYGLWLWRRDRSLRRWIVACAIGIPALWLVPDLLASGDALTGAERAREGSGAFVHETLESIGRSVELVLAALWLGAAVTVIDAWRHREVPILTIAAGAGAWIAIVALLAGGGYAGLPRFAAPAAAVVCVLGGIGLVRLVAAVDGMRQRDPRRHWGLGIAALAFVALFLQGALRVSEIPGELESSASFSDSVEDLDELIDEAGVDRIVSCRPIATTDFLTETALAWKLEIPLDAVHRHIRTTPPEGLAFVRDRGPAASIREIQSTGEEIERVAPWSLYEISCDPATSAASGRRIAGVAGASLYGVSSISPSSR